MGDEKIVIIEDRQHHLNLLQDTLLRSELAEVLALRVEDVRLEIVEDVRDYAKVLALVETTPAQFLISDVALWEWHEQTDRKRAILEAAVNAINEREDENETRLLQQPDKKLYMVPALLLVRRFMRPSQASQDKWLGRRKGAIVATGFERTVAVPIEALGFVNVLVKGSIADEGSREEIVRTIQTWAVGKTPEELVDELSNCFRNERSRPFPHDLMHAHSADGEFRKWAKSHFTGLKLDSAEHTNGAYEAFKGLGSFHPVRLGTVALIALYWLGRNRPHSTVQVEIDQFHGRLALQPETTVRPSQSYKRTQLLHLFSLLYGLDQEGQGIQDVQLGGGELRIVLQAGFSKDALAGLQNEYLKWCRQVGEWLLSSDWPEGTQLERWMNDRERGLSRAFFGTLMTSALPVHFETEELPFSSVGLGNENGKLTVLVKPISHRGLQGGP